MKATEFFATFSNGSGECKRTADPKPETGDHIVQYVDSWLNDGWVKIAQWADGSATLHGKNELFPSRKNAIRLLAASREHQAEAARQKAEAPETKEQANRRKVAKACAKTMRAEGVSASAARIGGMGAATEAQRVAQDSFRWSVAHRAGVAKRAGYIPSDATWQLACDMLEVAQ